MEVSIDRDACTACSLCEAMVPEVFSSDDEGIATIVEQPGEDLFDDVREAADACPADAIIIEE